MLRSMFKVGGFVSVVVFGLVLVSGCAKYVARPLPKSVGISDEINGVKVTMTKLTSTDCRHCFSRNALKKGYQPIQLCIENKSKQSYILDAKNIDLQIENSRDVARRLHLNTEGRMLGWGIPGLFFWPFLVAALVEGVWSNEANKKLDNDFSERVISDDSFLVVPSNSSINRVFFVKKENFKPSFNLVLENKNSGERLLFVVGDEGLK